MELQTISILFEALDYQATYIYQSGLVTVIWYNAVDFMRHQLSAAAASDPVSDAQRLLRAMLVAAKFRGEI